jgi:hypothetical protein
MFQGSGITAAESQAIYEHVHQAMRHLFDHHPAAAAEMQEELELLSRAAVSHLPHIARFRQLMTSIGVWGLAFEVQHGRLPRRDEADASHPELEEMRESLSRDGVLDPLSYMLLCDGIRHELMHNVQASAAAVGVDPQRLFPRQFGRGGLFYGIAPEQQRPPPTDRETNRESDDPRIPQLRELRKQYYEWQLAFERQNGRELTKRDRAANPALLELYNELQELKRTLARDGVSTTRIKKEVKAEVDALQGRTTRRRHDHHW